MGLILAVLGLMAGAAIHVMVTRHGAHVLANPPAKDADAALVLGNRAFIDGAPNPCLASRVDAAVALAQAGRVKLLVMSGGVDHEDGRIEADAMEGLARAAGYTGPVLRESASQSTRENLRLSRPLLEAAGVRRVIVVTEPSHLWRTRQLARGSGFEAAFDVQYATAPAPCRRWDRAARASLREVAA
ncbi:YdcF family protein, partial [Pseudacidovorax intermedius]|uniref:YdcF family protein n=1 Tax=Pseudacidovorax intermedius TaxID=433924 RepID=UPI0005BE01D0